MTSPEEQTHILNRDQFQVEVDQLSDENPLGTAGKRFLGSLSRIPKVDGLALFDYKEPRTPGILKTIVFADLVIGDPSAAETIEAVREADLEFSKHLAPPRTSSIYFINTHNRRPEILIPDLEPRWKRQRNSTFLACFIFKP